MFNENKTHCNLYHKTDQIVFCTRIYTYIFKLFLGHEYVQSNLNIRRGSSRSVYRGDRNGIMVQRKYKSASSL